MHDSGPTFWEALPLPLSGFPRAVSMTLWYDFRLSLAASKLLLGCSGHFSVSAKSMPSSLMAAILGPYHFPLLHWPVSSHSLPQSSTATQLCTPVYLTDIFLGSQRDVTFWRVRGKSLFFSTPIGLPILGLKTSPVTGLVLSLLLLLLLSHFSRVRLCATP